MDQRLSAILEHLRQKRRTAWLESLIVLLLGLGLMLLFPATGVSAFVLHLGRAIGLVLSLVGFFWHRRVLRWPEPEEEPVL
ncbi:MAG: hypothetical protein FJ125_17620, partial [Deltaproteobacteria bacterium]|nr:hypothetical protein [Deltaproteobacteria bacterium]